MKNRSAPIHVAKINRTHGGKTYTYHFLRQSFGDGAKVKHRTLGNLSGLPESTIDATRRALRGDGLMSVDEAVHVLRSRPHGHVARATEGDPAQPARPGWRRGAERQALTKVNSNGEPAQSFRALLGDLATLAKVRLAVAGNEFDRLADPTPVQVRAFSLLGVEL
ncbi:MAG: hypothetical protein EXR79_12805 [Myxococcales bacterium]|nr:hypothetical protein [Myxococcales bacterium]